MAYCVDSFSRGFTHTTRLLFQPFRLIFWIKAAFLFLFIQGITLFSPLDYLQDISPDDSMEQIAERALETLPTLIGVFVVSMLLGVIMEALHAWARFLFIDANRDGFVYYRASTNRHISGIVSLFLWNVIMKIAMAIGLLIGLVLLMIPNWLLAVFFEGQVGLILALTLDALFGVFLLFLYLFYTVLLDGVVVPQMAVKSTGIFDAWRKAFQLVGTQFGEIIGYALIRIALGLALFFFLVSVPFLFSFFTAGFFVAIGGSTMEIGEKMLIQKSILPIQIVSALFLLPIPLFRDAYALCFMARVNADNDFEPKSTDRLPQESVPVPVNENETDPMTGPVSFKDIPTERFNSGLEFPPPPEKASPTNTDQAPLPPSATSE